MQSNNNSVRTYDNDSRMTVSNNQPMDTTTKVAIGGLGVLLTGGVAYWVDKKYNDGAALNSIKGIFVSDDSDSSDEAEATV